MFAGIRLHRYSWAPKAKPYAFGLLLLAIIFGTAVSGWLTGVLMHVVGSHWAAAMISIALLSFSSGVIFALCGDAKKSNKENI
jgi:putative Ca2+/H+ antiporter (TMEM165/GDT1 family)